MMKLGWHGLASASVGIALLVGCAGKPVVAQDKPAAAPAAAAGEMAAKEYYVVLPDNGRYVAFGDAKTYLAFMKTPELAYSRTRIGAGPSGNTVVFGVTSDHVKKKEASPAELIFDGKLQAGQGFYGEVFKNGRHFVFNDFNDMKPFLSYGEVPYSFTDIGAGPNGATVVWVMNSKSIKQGRPTATMARFKEIHGAK